jgi:hypothetical protein
MTERKPPGTGSSWEPWIESQITAAMKQGAFDNLPGAGKPLPNSGRGFDPDWWVKQLFQREQVSMLLPPSLELVRKVRTELAAIDKLDDEWPCAAGLPRSTSRSPNSTRPWWRGRRRASARSTSIRSWRGGNGLARSILASWRFPTLGLTIFVSALATCVKASS